MGKKDCNATFLTSKISNSIVNNIIFSEPNNVNIINVNPIINS